MSINFDIVIDSQDYSVDMQSGLATLQGVSNATRTIAEYILTGQIVQRQSHKSKVRTNLKQTFKGSYGHIYSLEVYDDALKRKLNKIGKDSFAEIMSYFILESLYLDTKELSQKSKKIIEKFGENAEKLITQLRVSCLENIHDVSTKFNLSVKINLRQSLHNRTPIAEFNKKTAESLKAELIDKEYDIFVGITRFNIFTGNGRLLEKDTNETVPFSYEVKYEEIEMQLKKMLSDNLDRNNGLSHDQWRYLKLLVKPIKLRDGKILKYIVTGFYSE